jgi:hypothetical protein
LIDPVSQIFLVGRFLCFLAVFYLTLHNIVARLSRKPNSKLLWFFETLTAPLTQPVRIWLMPAAPKDRLLTGTLFFYGSLWLLLVILERILSINWS